jgi:hypothetical protein
MGLAELVATGFFSLLFGLLGLVFYCTGKDLAEGARRRAEQEVRRPDPGRPR